MIKDHEAGEDAALPDAVPGTVLPGERGITSVNHLRSAQSRLTAGVGIGLMGVLAAGVLTWYYRGALARASTPKAEAMKQLDRRAQGEMTLPPLGPRPVAPTVASTDVSGDASLDIGSAGAPAVLTGRVPSPKPMPAGLAAEGKDRRLEGNVFVSLGTADGVLQPGMALPPTRVMPTQPGVGAEAARSSSNDLSGLLTASVTPTASAKRLPTQRLLLPKGAFLDCTLETAIDSSFPGMTTCVTATDTYGADGSVVLLERGSKLIGETRGEVRQGGSRLFVLWTEARTPTGVVIPLASPGTDELGRSGLPGEVERHFWQRFGAALLISVVDSGLQTVSSAGRGTVIIGASGTREIMTEVLRETMRIAPTLRKPQGERIQVLVARDLDFRGVYRLTVDPAGVEP